MVFFFSLQFCLVTCTADLVHWEGVTSLLLSMRRGGRQVEHKLLLWQHPFLGTGSAEEPASQLLANVLWKDSHFWVAFLKALPQRHEGWYQHSKRSCHYLAMAILTCRPGKLSCVFLGRGYTFFISLQYKIKPKKLTCNKMQALSIRK